MASTLLTEAAVANDGDVLGDRNAILGGEGSPSAGQTVTPFIELVRGPAFIETEKGWNSLKDDGTPETHLSGRLKQWFRYNNGVMQAAYAVTGEKELPAPATDAGWTDVKGYPGLMTVHKPDGQVLKFFAVENATSDLWPPLAARDYNASMMFKPETRPDPNDNKKTITENIKAIFVDGPGKFIHRISGGWPALPCYLCGCISPGKYKEGVDLKDVHKVEETSDALDQIIEALGGWQGGKTVRVIIKTAS